MKYTFDNDLHIHSGISLCSNDAEQTPERILGYAVENGLKTICIAVHFWDETVVDFYLVVKQSLTNILPWDYQRKDLMSLIL